MDTLFGEDFMSSFSRSLRDMSLPEDRGPLTPELQSEAVKLTTVQFGWECRDRVFSIEWEGMCAERCRLLFHSEKRELRIELDLPTKTSMIRIQASQVTWCSVGLDAASRSSIIFLQLSYPPSFESAPRKSRPPARTWFESIMRGFEEQPIRQRTNYFLADGDHAPLAPFTSTSLRLICADRADAEKFREFCDRAKLRPRDYSPRVQRRQLFSPDAQSIYANWVRGLAWPVAFQVEAMVRTRLFDMREIVGLEARLQALVHDEGVAYAATFLRHFATQLKSGFYYIDNRTASVIPTRDAFGRCLRDYTPNTGQRARKGLPDSDVFQCLHASVTPTSYNLDGPYPERSNRIMRLYPQNHDCFLRVNFVDEQNLQYRYDSEVYGADFIRGRVGTILKKGLDIAGHHFEFLAYSQSALKQHAVWFVKPFTDHKGDTVNASTIIAGLGNFSSLASDPQLIFCPARYGARVSQAFTATDSSVKVAADEILMLDDIKDPTEKWCFTDGVGTISPDLAREIWQVQSTRQNNARKSPTYARALQIRFMGSKGMLSVDYRLAGRQVCLRPSMIKFDAPNSLDIEIARAFYKAGPFYLNRPLIMVLEDSGVPYEVFKKLQDDAVEQAQSAVDSLEKAARLSETFGLGASYRLTSVMLSLHKLGVGPLAEDDFWTRMMTFAINHVLRDLKHHARIPVPNAWNVVGVADVHAYLKPGEIFVCITRGEEEPIYLEGPTLVTRSPVCHPGDVQIAQAIGRPPPGSPFERETLRNTVVFSIQGSSTLLHSRRRRTDI